MAHWYDEEGGPHHSAGIKEARANNYFASVTTVMHTKNKPFLNEWLQKEVLKLALKQNRYDADLIELIVGLSSIVNGAEVGSKLKTELIKSKLLTSYGNVLKNCNNQSTSDPDFIDSIINYQKTEGGKAAILGTAIHKSIELSLERGSKDNIFKHRFFPIRKKTEKIDYDIERGGKGESSPWYTVLTMVYNHLETGYILASAFSELTVLIKDLKLAGTVDLIIQNKLGEWVMIDFKSQNPKPYFTKYIEWIMQLAAYKKAVDLILTNSLKAKTPVVLKSLAISSDSENPKIKEYEYNKQEEIDNGYTMIRNCAENYYIEKKHHPKITKELV